MSVVRYNPLATGCLSTKCFALFDAPATVDVGDILACPKCGALTKVIDRGRDPSRIEYLRTRPLQPSEKEAYALAKTWHPYRTKEEWEAAVNETARRLGGPL